MQSSIVSYGRRKYIKLQSGYSDNKICNITKQVQGSSIGESWIAFTLIRYSKRGKIPNNFNSTITNEDLRRKAVLSFKDEYLLDFINIEDPDELNERILENKIVLHIKISALDEYVKLPHENPSIGIILCKSQSQKIVEFAFRDTSKPIGVATFQLATQLPEQYRNILPDAEMFKKLL